MASDTLPKLDKASGKAREKVELKPGYHLSDWVRMSQTMATTSLSMPLVTAEELSKHSSPYDCWTAYNGKVYNITMYLPYHPGGEEKLMLGAGKDCTELFKKYHPWVNADRMLGKHYIGKLVISPPEISEGIDHLQSTIEEDILHEEVMKALNMSDNIDEHDNNDDNAS